MLDQLIEAPTKQEMEDELYADEVNASGNMEQGRNAYTGY
jgi:hypothetical protein